jgi:hypothetical protein
VGVEEQARLIVEAEAKGFTDTDAAIKANEAKLAALTASYKAGTIGYDEYTAKGSRLQGKLDELRESYKVADDALKKYGSTMAASAALTEKATNKLAGLGQVGLQSGRIVQDFAQGGVAGILNNIEGATQALGLGPGLAGVLTMVGVAAFIAKPHLEALWKALNPNAIEPFVDELTKLNGRIKDLEEKKVKVAVDILELDAARDRVNEIKAALAAVAKLENTQAKAEKESGAAIGEILAESPEGGAEVKRKLRAQLAPKAEADSTALREARAREEEAKQELTKLRPTDIGLRELALKRLEKAKADAMLAKSEIDKEEGSLDKMVGAVLEAAQNKGGAVQAQGQRQLIDLLDKAGLKNLAANVKASSPKQIQANKVAKDELEARAAREKEEATAAKNADDAAVRVIKQSLTDELDILKGIGGLDDIAERLTAEAKRKNLNARDTFEHVKRGVDEATRAALAQRGFTVPAGREQLLDEPVGDLATDEAKKARLSVESEAAKAKRASDAAAKAAGKKEARGEAKTDDEAFAAEAARVLDQLQAQAKRIDLNFGKEASMRFGAGMASAPMGSDPQKVAAELVREMTAMFRTLPGVSAQGAGLAARQVAARQGFEVGVQPLGRMPGSVDRFGRPIRARIPARPRPGKRPLPQPRPKLATPTPAQPTGGVGGRSTAAGPRANAPPFREPLPDANAALQQRREAMGLGGPQAALDQTLRTQGAIGGVQESVAALEARLRKSEANLARIDGTNRQSLTRINESQPTAQPMGDGVA